MSEVKLDPGANPLRSSVVAVNPFGPDHANVGAGDPFDAVKLIEPSFTFEHDWLFTIDDKLGAVHDDGIVNEHGVPKVRFALVALKFVTDVEVPTYPVNPDVVPDHAKFTAAPATKLVFVIVKRNLPQFTVAPG